MDLSSFDTTKTANEGAVMNVLHPQTQEQLLQEDGRPITITLAGIDSDIFRRAKYAASNRVMKVFRAGNEDQAESIDNDNLSTLSVCTLAWDGIKIDGELLKCTPENAKKAYTRLPWLREQADEFMARRGNYLKASAKPSSVK